MTSSVVGKRRGHQGKKGVLAPGPAVGVWSRGNWVYSPSPKNGPGMGQCLRNLAAPFPQESSVPVARILIPLPHNACSPGPGQGNPAGHWATSGKSGSTSLGPTWSWLAVLGWPGSICLFPSPVLNYRDKMPLMLVQDALDGGSHFPFFPLFNLKVSHIDCK